MTLRDADWTIRPATPADAVALGHLHLDVWDDAYTGLIPQSILDERRARAGERIERWRQILARDHANLVAETADGLVGFTSSGPGRDADLDGTLELWALYVRAARWGTGLGHALLMEAIGDGPAYLWVLGANERAIGFYERHGFAFDGVTRDEVEGHERRMVR